MSDQIRVLVADDHPLMRSGIAAEINAEADMSIVASAGDGEEAISLFRSHRPDVSLIDLRMPKMNGLDLLSAIRADFPAARIIILTTASGDVHAIRAFRLGAAGYLLKHMLRNDLITTIRDIHAGKRRIPDEVAQLLAQHAMEEQMTRERLMSWARSRSADRTRSSDTSFRFRSTPSRPISRQSSLSWARVIGLTLSR